MKQLSKQKAQLIFNGVLTILTLFALIVSVFAWFSNNKYANVDSIELKIDRKSIVLKEQPQNILLPCSTKFDDVLADDFNDHCVVVAKYVVEGDGKLFAEVHNSDGILGYVWDETVDGVLSDKWSAENHCINGSVDYYSVISNKLSKQLSGKDYTYTNMAKALNSINKHQAGKLNANGDTEVYIVYWGHYDEFKSAINAEMNEISGISYGYKSFNVKVTFVS